MDKKTRKAMVKSMKVRRKNLDCMSEAPGQWATLFSWISLLKDIYELLMDLLDADDPAEKKEKTEE